jgi:hypothetical protein
MKRTLFAAVLAGLVCFGTATVRAQDEVTHYDRTAHKDVVTTGKIQEETAAGIKIKSGQSVKEIPAGDITEVVHDVSVPRLTYRRPFNTERDLAKEAREANRKKMLADALKGYKELLPRVSANKLASRHIQFKIAEIMARQAEDDPAAVEPAITELTKFKNEYPNSWQILRVAKLLADLHLHNNNTAAAEKIYTDLAKSPDLPKEVRQEIELLSARLLIEGKKYDEAEQKLKSLTIAADDPAADQVKVYVALCTGVRDKTKLPAAVTQIEETINQTKDPNLKALAHNALGDCYRLNGQLKDAVWEYLWVDMVYNQDKRLQMQAVEQLAKLYDDLKEDKLAQEYRDRIKKAK